VIAVVVRSRHFMGSSGIPQGDFVMRKTVVCMLAVLLVALAGCVTINVYFPEAAAQKAADKFIGSVLDQATPASTPKDNNPPSPPADKPASDGRQPPSASVLDLLVPAAYAADTAPDLRIHTPEVDAIHTRMQQRFRNSLKALLDSGAVGFTADGLVAVRDISSVPLAQRSTINTAVADENRDRTALYREIANANGHPEWESQIRQTFAALWIEKAHAGWYYRSASGSWKKK
jgi:uncharacterized protein YdbL (DUF1318 family)